MKAIRILMIAAIALMLLTSFPIAASPQNTRATLYYLHNSWNTKFTGSDEADLKEGVFGLSAALSASDRILFELDGTMTSAKLEQSGMGPSYSTDLSSLNDTRLALTIFSPGGVTSLTASANLPTGKTKLDDDEYLVAAAIGDNSRKFLVRRFGQGLDLGVNGGIHPKAGSLVLHLGAGYLLKGKFQARAADTEKYKFGDEINATAGFSADMDKVALAGNAAVIYYMKDKVGDVEVFQAGVATMIRGSISYTNIMNLYTGVGVLMRGKGKIQGGSSSDLVDETERSGRNEFLWYAGGGYPINDKLRLNGRLEFQNFSANDFESGNPLYRPKSNYFGIGGGGSLALTPGLFASTMITLYSGSTTFEESTLMEAADYDLSGLGLLFALTYRVM